MTSGMLQWAKNNADGFLGIVQIRNFQESWRDGLAFCALVANWRPDLIEDEDVGPNKAMHNLGVAFSAMQAMNLAVILDPEDVVDYCDKKCIVAQLSVIQRLLANAQPAPRQPPLWPGGNGLPSFTIAAPKTSSPAPSISSPSSLPAGSGCAECHKQPGKFCQVCGKVLSKDPGVHSKSVAEIPPRVPSGASYSNNRTGAPTGASAPSSGSDNALCSHCGKMGLSRKFCEHCGKPFAKPETASPQSSSSVRHCPKCNTVAKSKFCDQCGGATAEGEIASKRAKHGTEEESAHVGAPAGHHKVHQSSPSLFFKDTDTRGTSQSTAVPGSQQQVRPVGGPFTNQQQKSQTLPRPSPSSEPAQAGPHTLPRLSQSFEPGSQAGSQVLPKPSQGIQPTSQTLPRPSQSAESVPKPASASQGSYTLPRPSQSTEPVPKHHGVSQSMGSVPRVVANAAEPSASRTLGKPGSREISPVRTASPSRSQNSSGQHNNSTSSSASVTRPAAASVAPRPVSSSAHAAARAAWTGRSTVDTTKPEPVRAPSPSKSSIATVVPRSVSDATGPRGPTRQAPIVPSTSSPASGLRSQVTTSEPAPKVVTPDKPNVINRFLPSKIEETAAQKTATSVVAGPVTTSSSSTNSRANAASVSVAAGGAQATSKEPTTSVNASATAGGKFLKPAEKPGNTLAVTSGSPAGSRSASPAPKPEGQSHSRTVSAPGLIASEKCAKCGTPHAPGGKFCAECGTPFAGGVVTASARPSRRVMDSVAEFDEATAEAEKMLPEGFVRRVGVIVRIILPHALCVSKSSTVRCTETTLTSEMKKSFVDKLRNSVLDGNGKVGLGGSSSGKGKVDLDSALFMLPSGQYLEPSDVVLTALRYGQAKGKGHGWQDGKRLELALALRGPDGLIWKASWQPDKVHSKCQRCHKVFTLFIRRHHCRRCGQVVCADCSGSQGIVAGFATPQRICTGCAAV